MTPRKVANNLSMFEFTIINISNNIDVKILSDSLILVMMQLITTGRMICLFISNINIIVDASKKLRKIMQQGQIRLAMQEKLQNLSNNYNCSNVNSMIGIHYSLDGSMIVMLRIRYYDEFDANANEIDYIYQIAYEINNFIITIINLSDLITNQINNFAGEAYLFIGMVFTIDSSFTIRFLDALTIIFDGIRLKIVEVNEFKCVIGNGCERGNELQFEFENENENVDIDCGELCGGIIVCNNGFDDSALSTPTPSQTPLQRVTIFDSGGIDAESPAIEVLQCQFN